MNFVFFFGCNTWKTDGLGVHHVSAGVFIISNFVSQTNNENLGHFSSHTLMQTKGQFVKL